MPKEEMSPSGFYAAVAEQFTHFGTVQVDGDEIANPTGQRLDSSITQFVIGYDINERFALQFNAHWATHYRVARPNQLGVGSGVSGSDEHDSITGSAGL